MKYTLKRDSRMDFTVFSRISSSRRIRLAVAAACFTLGACGSMPKFPAYPSTTAGPVSTQPADHGLGRTVMTGGDERKNIVSVVSQGKYGYVRIERAGAAAQGPNDHPVRLDAGQIRTMLGKLQVRRGGEDAASIFTEDELEELGASLAEALAKAGPGEDVTFATTDRHKGGVLGPLMAHTVTAGRAFYKGGLLNVIFGEIRGEFESQFLATGYMRPFLTGSRAGKGDVHWTVASREPLRYAAAGRPDWIQVGEAPVAPAAGASPVAPVAPAASASPVAPAAPAASASPAAPAAPAGAASPPSASTRPGAGAAPTSSAGTTSTAGAASTTGSASPAIPASPAPAVVPNRGPFYQDIERRLTVLKGLRDKGLITEDEYNEKRKAILKDL